MKTMQPNVTTQTGRMGLYESPMQPAVQILETVGEEELAERLYTAMALQEGVTHVRLLRPSRSKPGFRVQALMVGEKVKGLLPDGMREVMVDDRILRLFDEVS